MARVKTTVKKYNTAKEASAARKIARHEMAVLALQGYWESQYPEEKPGACFYEDGQFCVIFVAESEMAS
jgi:hypothetical protein